MNILVSGGAGYIGSHTAKYISNRGGTPFIIDTLENGSSDFVKWGAFFEADTSDEKTVFQILQDNKIESIVHFAGYAYVGESTQKPLKYFRNNSAGLVSLLKASEKAKIKKIVFSSTCATYGVPENIPIRETEKQSPINPYGHSKLMAEKILNDFANASRTQVVALRYFNAAGADLDCEIGEDHQPETHLIPLALRACYDDHFTLQVFGNDYPTTDGSCVRDYIHVNDLASAHLSAIELNMDKPFSVFNLGTGRGHSVFEIISTIEKIAGKEVKYQVCPRRWGDPPVLVANSQRAQDKLQWKAQYSDLDTIISSANNWYKKRFLKLK